MTRDEIADAWAWALGAFAAWLLMLAGGAAVVSALPPAACAATAELRPADPAALWRCFTRDNA